MYHVSTTNTFEKGVAKCKKRGYDMSLLAEVIRILEATGTLPSKYKPHKLSGTYQGAWECHIKPDWLLVWKQYDDQLVLILTNTGTHANLF